jgi:acyl-CoA synthetase (AMP-forming)/AMP-acid ligase II
MTGATMVPEPVFDVGKVVERIEQEHISVLPGPPTIFQSILDNPDHKSFDLDSLRLVVTGAALVPVELSGACGTTSASRRCSPPTGSPRRAGR